MSTPELIPTVAVSDDFRTRAHEALGDKQLRNNFRSAMDSLMAKRAASFSDAHEREHLRALGNAIRARALSKLPDLLEQLEQNLTRNGVTVHWAETVDEANGIVLSIIRAHEARQVIKGKSMVSEEMEMNHVLAEQGIECLESDMGEFIVQLDHEKPSHIIMPAIHKNAGQVASLFHDKLGVEYTKDVDQLIQIGRKVLRQKFFEADIGVSGVNFAVAETGTLLLVENEGNGRMSTTVPPVHIAVTGIEKVVENLRDVVPLLSLLTRSALGQPITTYVNMISGPRKAHELDGPDEVHLVLLDNGRSQAFADSELRQTLNCIRCGACMNHCPVYTRIGGHAYGEVYPGPIGKIITPHMVGPGQGSGSPQRLVAVRRLWRSLPGEDSDPGPAAPTAGRKRQGHRQPTSSDARPGQQVLAQGTFYMERLGPPQQLASALSVVRPGGDTPARLDAQQRRALDAKPQRAETGRPFAARPGTRAPGQTGRPLMSAKQNILAKLRTSLTGATPIVDNFDEALVTEPYTYTAEQRIPQLRKLMEAVHTEIHLTTGDHWPTLLAQLLNERQLPSLLIAPSTPHGQRVTQHWAQHPELPPLKAYDRPVEAWKAELFNDTPASLTTTLGAIAATGSLILWPTREEPRLMSLVPPVHFALLKASEIRDNFYQVQQEYQWAQGMPTNALLVSGPSKTADIEQVLAYGAHGPKDLVVLILEDQ